MHYSECTTIPFLKIIIFILLHSKYFTRLNADLLFLYTESYNLEFQLVKDKTALLEKAGKIKMVITDIDGVWTDGGLYYTADGLVMKRFQVKDGMGVHLLRNKGIETAIISGDVSPMGVVRGQRLKVELIYKDILDKKTVLNEILRLRNLESENIAYIGDDVNDLDVLRSVGLSASPADACEEVLNCVDYICRKNGGQGAFRELADMILAGQAEEE